VIRVLFVNVFDTLQGDVNGFLAAFCQMDANRFERFALSNPRGAVYRKLTESGRVRVTTAELGGESGARGAGIGSAAGFVRAIKSAAQLIRRERIDVVYAVDRTRGAFISAFAARLTGRPLVVSSNAYFYGDRPATRAVLQAATLIHSCSNSLRTNILRHVPKPDRVVTIHHGLPIERYDLTTSGAAARRALGVPESSPLVVLPGRMVAYKGQGDLLAATASVLRCVPDAHFVVCGGDDPGFVPGRDEAARARAHGTVDAEVHAGADYRKQLIDRAHRDGIADRFLVKEAWPWDAFPQLLAAADVVAMPSWGEAFGLVALEGMAMAKPVVATAVHGIPEFMSDGISGVLVPPQNSPALATALVQLLSNPVEAGVMGRNGRQIVEEHFNAARYVRDVSSLLAAAVAETVPSFVPYRPNLHAPVLSGGEWVASA
jgi:glycosyltransferase involved in cell wall biosynthesis